jgi:hypothetical protein
MIFAWKVFWSGTMLEHWVILKWGCRAGCFVLWLAGIDHTLHHRGNGGLWPRVWWNWSCLLAVTLSSCVIVGCVATFRCFSLIHRV